jgi:hypothetical protein
MCPHAARRLARRSTSLDASAPTGSRTAQATGTALQLSKRRDRFCWFAFSPAYQIVVGKTAAHEQRLAGLLPDSPPARAKFTAFGGQPTARDGGAVENEPERSCERPLKNLFGFARDLAHDVSTVQRAPARLDYQRTFTTDLTSKQNKLSIFAQPLPRPSDSLSICRKR